MFFGLDGKTKPTPHAGVGVVAREQYRTLESAESTIRLCQPCFEWQVFCSWVALACWELLDRLGHLCCTVLFV